MERKESRGRRGASWELPQQSGPIAAELWDVSGSPEPSLTMIYIYTLNKTLNIVGYGALGFFSSHKHSKQHKDDGEDTSCAFSYQVR